LDSALYSTFHPCYSHLSTPPTGPSCSILCSLSCNKKQPLLRPLLIYCFFSYWFTQGSYPAYTHTSLPYPVSSACFHALLFRPKMENW
jgi:hypothetical protein